MLDLKIHRHDRALKDAIQELDWLIAEATRMRDHVKEHLLEENSDYGYRGYHSMVHMPGSLGKITASLAEAKAYGDVHNEQRVEKESQKFDTY